jgi:hypothetical protein
MDNSSIGEDVGNNTGPQPNERQQTKIIAALTSGDYGVFGHDNVQVDSNARSNFIEEMSLGRFDRDTEKVALSNISSPVDVDDKKGTSRVFDTLSSNPRLVSIAASLLSGGDDRRISFTQYSPRNLIDQFPTPFDVEGFKTDYINSATQAGWGELAESSFDQFETTLYGKRKEYADQMKLLEREAAIHKRTSHAGNAARGIIMLDSMYQIPADEAAIASAAESNVIIPGQNLLEQQPEQPAETVEQPTEEPAEQLSPEAIAARREEIKSQLASAREKLWAAEDHLYNIDVRYKGNGLDYGATRPQFAADQEYYQSVVNKLKTELDALNQ